MITADAVCRICFRVGVTEEDSSLGGSCGTVIRPEKTVVQVQWAVVKMVDSGWILGIF